MALRLDDSGVPFTEPWQAQAFALTIELHAKGAFSWADWTRTLAEQLETSGAADDGSRYYEHWLAALERLVTEAGMASAAELAQRNDAYAHTPHGQPVELR